MQVFKSFLLRELVFTVLVASVAFILFSSILSQYYLPIFWILFVGIALLTGLVHFSNLRFAEKEFSKFSSRFVMMTGIKMIIYLFVIVFYVFLNTTNAKIFLVYFIIIYLLYTAFEVISIVKHFKTNR